jgi:hypothetical protein
MSFSRAHASSGGPEVRTESQVEVLTGTTASENNYDFISSGILLMKA